MNPGKPPKADRIKPGIVFYSVEAYYDEERNAVSVDINEWHVRSVRAKRGSVTRYGIKTIRAFSEPTKYVNLTRKTSCTWVKKSRKHFDYGWASSISDRDRLQFILGSEFLPLGIYTTPLQAAKYERNTLQSIITSTEKWLKENADTADPADLAEETEERKRYIRMLKAVESRIRKLTHERRKQ